MENMLNEWIDRSCDKALVECDEYIKKEYEGNCSDVELRVMSDRLIYKRAVNDVFTALKLLKII